MRFVKLILISVIVLFAILTALSLVFPSHLRISRAINIGAPKEKVYGVVNDLRTWDSWNKFISGTPLTHVVYSSPSAGKGAFLRSDQLLLTIRESSPDSIKLDWAQVRGKKWEGGFNFLQLSRDSLTVQWYFDF